MPKHTDPPSDTEPPRDIEAPDDATRPEPPRFDGLTEAQRMPGRHLAMIHDHFRDNMRLLRALIDKAASGEADPAALKAEAEASPLFDNYRRFGNLCGQHCQIIALHHSIEDQAVFPELRSQSEALRKVVDRLQAEHVVVHELLVRLAGALAALAEDATPERFAAARAAYDALETVLLSHFGYEEDAIGDALGVYGVGI